jgi:hypothetical protein
VSYFFLPNTHFQNSFMGEGPFLCFHKGMERGEAEKKVTFHSSLPHFALSAMHEAVSKAVLPNSFSKTA